MANEEVQSSRMQLWSIFVLSLPGDEERRLQLLGSLDACALTYEVFIGIDGRKGLPEFWEKAIDRAAAKRKLLRELTDAEFACALSHRKIYRTIHARGLSGAIVLEDDAIVGESFASFIRERRYQQAGLIMLDHKNARVSETGVEIMSGVRMRRLALPPFLTTGYSISSEVARSLLRSSSPVTYTADWPGDIGLLGAVALDPRVVDHPNNLEGVSHLREGRDHARSRSRTSRFTSFAKRWLSAAYRKRWIKKRRSTKIS